MRKTRTLAAAALLAAMIPATLLAQGGPPQGGPPRQGGPGMPPPMMPMGGPAILFRPDVQKELKLTEEQTEKLRDAVPGPGGPPPQGGFQGGPPRQGGQGGPPQPPDRLSRRGPEEMEKIDKQVKAILDEKQYARYHELDLQLAGAMAIGRPDVAEKLKLTDEQKEQLREAMRPEGQPGLPPRDGGQGGPPEPPRRFDPQQMEQQRKEMEKKVLAVLTDEQRALWQKMLGKPFAFEKTGPPPGGLPRGGGGGL